MISLFNIAVINALTIVPLALVVWLVSRVARRPALTHALWVLVLLKLVTPPLLQWPVIEIPVAQMESELVQPAGAAAMDTAPRDTALPTTPAAGPRLTSTAVMAAESVSATSVADSAQSVDAPEARSPRSVGKFVLPSTGLMLTLSSWWEVLACVWCVGGVVAFGIQGWYAVRFARCILKASTPDPDLQNQVAELARQMNLRTVPDVRIVAATVSPLLWSCGSRVTLLFPVALMKRLDSDSVATLLMHELAHYRRGDHWVRWLELVATSLFWWHPVVWWARYQIEDSEEECCDACVVAQVPQMPRTYAEALLDTIDFLCNAPRDMPPLASGLGNAAVLRRRLTKIMSGPSANSMSRRLRLTVGLLAAFLLPMGPLVFGSGTNLAIRPAGIATAGHSRLLPTPADTPKIDVPSPSSDTESDLETPAPRNDAGNSKSRRQRNETVWSTAVSPDGRFIIRATTGRRVVLSDLSSSRETDLSSHGITAVSFAPDKEQFAAISADGKLTVWDAVTAELRQVLYTHESALRTVAVSPRGDTVAVGSSDGTLLIVNMRTGNVEQQFSRLATSVNCVRYSQDGNRLAVALGDWRSDAPGKIRLMELQTGTSVDLDCQTTPGAVMFVSNDELIVGEWNGHSTLWNLVSHEIVGAAVANKNIVAAASFSPDNPQLREIAFVSSGFTDE